MSLTQFRVGIVLKLVRAGVAWHASDLGQGGVQVVMTGERLD